MQICSKDCIAASRYTILHQLMGASGEISGYVYTTGQVKSKCEKLEKLRAGFGVLVSCSKC